MDAKYNIEAELTTVDGNAFMILGTVRKALVRGGVSNEEIDDFMTDATSGDYDHLLQVVMSTVTVT